MSSFSSTLAAHDLKLLALLDKGTEDEAIKFYLEIKPFALSEEFSSTTMRALRKASVLGQPGRRAGGGHAYP
ncbi:hypothetical protein H0H81_006118 [Sphagnurus paluster]|uniref:Uncharacterized protein n=1 Tax=Sphagnurus paluster TaxID=117069 RepID=A0A9P7KHV0_9AGAR|nr:hypothetical protein H0H81_006118 [Sphagnurus paluster]